MTDLEVFRLSAEGCGHRLMQPTWKPVGVVGPSDECYLLHGSVWNPFTNADQRWQCVEKLLENGDATLILSGRKDPHEFCDGQGEDYRGFNLRCHASEFPARALAELQKRKPMTDEQKQELRMGDEDGSCEMCGRKDATHPTPDMAAQGEMDACAIQFWRGRDCYFVNKISHISVATNSPTEK